MAVLVNELSWSFSRQGMFNECRRKYFYRYYLMWDGWNQGVDEKKREAYVIKNMMNVDIFIGSKVHEEISRVLRRLSMLTNGQTSLKKPEIDGAAIEKVMSGAFLASESKLYKTKSPKQYPPFYEDYYGGGIPREKHVEAVEKVIACVKNFIGSDIYGRLVELAEAGMMTWRHIDGSEERNPASFALDDVIKVYAVPDLSIGVGDALYQFDWKTGKIAEATKDQMACYALFAGSRWGIPAEAIKSRAVSLYPEVLSMTYTFLPEDLIAVADMIREGYREMEHMHPAGLALDEESFGTRAGFDGCDGCFYQGICE